VVPDYIEDVEPYLPFGELVNHEECESAGLELMPIARAAINCAASAVEGKCVARLLAALRTSILPSTVTIAAQPQRNDDREWITIAVE
jgi:hypothetical protein